MASKKPFRYRGYYYDVETGLYYLQSRYYDPVTCRFISGDVFIQSAQGMYDKNVFAYCENEPVNRIDSEGTFWILFTMIVLGGAVIGAGAQIASNVCSNNPETNWYDGLAGAAIGGGITTGVSFVTGNPTLGAYLGTAAGSVTNEVISYASGEKDLTWDNIQQSNITVLQDTTANLAVGKIMDQAIPNIKLPAPKKITNNSTLRTGKTMFENGLTTGVREFGTNVITSSWLEPTNVRTNSWTIPTNTNYNQPRITGVYGALNMVVNNILSIVNQMLHSVGLRL